MIVIVIMPVVLILMVVQTFLWDFPFVFVERKRKPPDPCEIPKMEFFTKTVIGYSKKLHLRCLARF